MSQSRDTDSAELAAQRRNEMKETKTAQTLTAALPHLAGEINRQYSHCDMDLTGLTEIIEILGGCPEPVIDWCREIRGTDAVITPRLIVPCVTQLNDVYGMVTDLVPVRPGRYRHATKGGSLREAEDRRQAEAALAAVLPIWRRMTLHIVMRLMSEPVWHQTYEWAQPGPARYVTGSASAIRAVRQHDCVVTGGIDPQSPCIRLRPITQAAYAEARLEAEEVRLRLLIDRAQLLSVTAADVLASENGAINLNRVGYLPRLAGLNRSNRWTPRGYFAAVEADREIIAHVEKLRAEVRFNKIETYL